MTFKNIIIAASLTLTVAAAAFAEEPKSAAPAAGTPAASAPPARPGFTACGSAYLICQH